MNLALKIAINRHFTDPGSVLGWDRLGVLLFPSGHVVQYTALFGCAFFLVYVLAAPSTWRTIGLILLALPIVLVGPSRLYLGQHWLSDVLGGYALAVLFLVPYCWALKGRGTTSASTP